MTWRLSAPDDLNALLTGLGIFGTGGGGDPKGWGRSVFDADRAAGRTYELVDAVDVEDDAFILSGGYLGSVAEDVSLNRVVQGWEAEFELEKAIRVLEVEHGRRADYLVPFELGGGNTPVVMSCAARLGIPMIDGDGVGRAAPETHMLQLPRTRDLAYADASDREGRNERPGSGRRHPSGRRGRPLRRVARWGAYWRTRTTACREAI